jgi:dTDP-glucose pyrophosphorylase
MRKGIILSGGLGTRLYPCTKAISKQLLPVYDKPLVYYPISTLMMAGIRDIMIITSPSDRKPLDNNGDPIRIVEKPKIAPSNYAVTGLYFYDNKVVEYAWRINPSARGELEITDINNLYMQDHDCRIEYLNRGIAWIDTGTFESLSEASVFVGSVQRRTGMMIACPEEIAYKNAWITENQIRRAAEKYSKSDYGKYLGQILRTK